MKYPVLLIAALLASVAGKAKDVKDTIFSTAGDRIIVNYSVSQSGGQMAVKFNGVQKKLGKRNQESYNRLDRVAVVMFDRIGNYSDMKFEGMAAEAFMVPSNMSYTRSEDGYFLLQDTPTLNFSINSGNKAKLSVPIYLAYYEKKHRYKIFAKCSNLIIDSKASAGRKSKGGVSGGGEETVTVTTTEEEEVADGGVSPAEEANIRISSLRSMLDKATKLPFSEELTHEASMLRELRFKTTDPGVSSQINEVLEAYENKKQELEQQADADAKAAQAAQEAKAQKDLARSDSLTAVQALQAAKEKKDLLWIIGGIAGFILAIVGGKQAYQQWSMKKMQKKMMDSMKKAMTPGTSMGNIAGGNNPLNSIINEQQRKGQQAMRRALSKEAEAAKQKMMRMRQKDMPQPAAHAEPLKPKRPSLNDAIPKKYKRWRKPGTEDKNNNVTI